MSYGYKNDNLTELEKLNVKILEFQLAFENYEDNLGLNSNEFSLINEKTGILWHHNDNLSEEEKIILAKEIINDYKKMYDNLPNKDKERFTFEDDGSINYEWDMSLIKKVGKDGN